MRLVVVKVDLSHRRLSSYSNERGTNATKLRLGILESALLARGVGQHVIDESLRLLLAKLCQAVASEAPFSAFSANISDLPHVCGVAENRQHFGFASPWWANSSIARVDAY